MRHQPLRDLPAFIAIAILSASTTLAQSANSSDRTATSTLDSWQSAQQLDSSKHKLFVVTRDRPDHRQTCHVQSFTGEKLVCRRAVRGPRTYVPQQVIALLIPGDAEYKLHFVLFANVGLGAAIWGTVVLAATCPACAVATGIVALVLFGAAGAVLVGDDQPDRLLYLAPGQKLSTKLGFIQS